MTFKYWLKIVLGMLVIFAIGAFGVRAVRHGEAFVNSDRTIDIPMLGASFKLGGERLGKMQRMRIDRSSPRRVSGVALTVRLDDSLAMSRFDGCSLAITDASNINKNTTFVCTDAADSSRLKLVPFGTVTFYPGNHEVVLLVPQSVVVDLQHNMVGGANDGANVGGDSGSLHMTVKDSNGKTRVNVRATHPPRKPNSP